MKKIYPLIIIFSFLLYNNAILAQCSVSISTNPNTTQLNCKNTSITLSATGSGSGNLAYLWSTGETTKSIEVKDSETYVVTVTDTAFCNSSSSIHITKDITPPTVSILAFPDTICSGSSSALIGFGADTYQWQTGSFTGNPFTVMPPATTSYTVTGTAANGCTGTNTFNLVVNPLPNASISADATGCQYGGEPGVTFKGSNGNKPYTFAYNINGGSVQTVTTNQGDTSIRIGVSTGQSGSITYNLISVTDGSGCSQTQSGTVVVNILPAPAFTSSKTESVCSNTSFDYTATSSVPGTTFKWKRDTVAGITNQPGSGLTASINDNLHNNTTQPVVVNYVFTLSTGTGCETIETLKVTVNPTPAINPISNYTFCNGAFVNGISFSSASPDSTFAWASNTTIGFGTSGSSSIPSFVATNMDSVPVVARVAVLVTASSNKCAATDSSIFKITVNPTPNLISPRFASVCNNEPFYYTAISSGIGTNFKWKRDAVAGITNQPGSGLTESISETLNNTTSQPIVVNYVYTLSPDKNSVGCDKRDTVKVTVNPTPKINSINDISFCNGVFVSNGIPFSSASPDPSFTWASDIDVGFGKSGNGSIPPFIAIDSGTTSLLAKVTVKVTASSDYCPGADTIFTITVKPTPNLISPKVASVCNNAPFSYTAFSSAANTKFKWKRDAVPGITNQPGSGSTESINDTLRNNTTQPVVVNYVYTLSFSDSNAASCSKTDTLKVTINPTPKIDPISDKSFCNGDFVSNGIPFSSTSPNASFTWASADTTIGFGSEDSGSIQPFIAIDTGTVPVVATVTVKVTASRDQCPGVAPSVFRITVKPTPNLISPKVASVCDNAPFSYTAFSSAAKTKFEWKRDTAAGITNKPGSGSTASINEILHNDSTQPVVVNYVYTLIPDSNAEKSCSKTDTLKVTVNPTPKIDLTPIHGYTFCNGAAVNGIGFSSTSPDSSFTWTCTPTIGFGSGGSGSIPVFMATNNTTVPIAAKVAVKISASNNNCSGADTSFIITVYPTPIITSSTDMSVCDNTLFIYKATSSAAGTKFRWARESVTGIANGPAGDGTASISETLHNTTSQPVVVNYLFTLTSGNDCDTIDTVKVKVNPTPVINLIPNYTFCNGDQAKQIIFGSASPNASFTWKCSKSVGFGLSGNGNIPAFTATNTDTIPIVDTVTVSIRAGSDSCVGSDSVFTITVRPSPLKPGFTSFSRYPDTEILLLCDSSQNINFNLNSPAAPGSGVSYKWSSKPDMPKVFIKDRVHPNTVISFNNPGIDTISVLATNNVTGCESVVSQLVQVSSQNIGNEQLKIFKKQPGNLLVYPDKSFTGYQWGYDSLIQALPDTAFGPPVTVPGQVYQFFIPDARFITNDSLDESKHFFWVLLNNNDGCYTKIYYNGPYDDKQDSVRRSNVDNAVQLLVMPNPNKGVFEINLKGNIYGHIDAKIYNALGGLVFRKKFEKTVPEINEKFSINNLPAGFYFLILNSSDLKKVSSKFIISH